LINSISLENIDLSLGLNQITDPLNTYQQQCKDIVVDVSTSLRFVLLNQFHKFHELTVEELQLDSNAEQQIYQRLKIPHLYLSRCPFSLQKENVSYWLGQHTKKLLFRAKKTATQAFLVRGVLSERFMTTEATKDDFLAIPQILSTQLGSTEQNTIVEHLEKTDHFTTCTTYNKPRIVNHEHGTFVPGLMVSNSEVGLASLKIQPTIIEIRQNKPNLHFISSNSLGCRRFHHIGLLTPENLLKAVNTASGVAQRGVVELLVKAHEEVDSPHQIISQILNKKSLLNIVPNKLIEQVANPWANTPSATKLDIARSILDATSHLDQISCYQIKRVVGAYLQILLEE